MGAQMLLASLFLTLLTSMGILMCHPPSWRSSYPPLFQPEPQFCPDTGRTVCAAVDYYPAERIFNLLRSARSQVFNLTSLFVDERKGDPEPNLSQLVTHPPYYQDRDGYRDNQPPPGGRFSPAGRLSMEGDNRGLPNGRDTNPWREVPSMPSRLANNNNDQDNRSSYDSQESLSPRRTNSRQMDNKRLPQHTAMIAPYDEPRRDTAYRDDIPPPPPVLPFLQQRRMPDEKINYASPPSWDPTQPVQNSGMNPSHQMNVPQNNNKGQRITGLDYTWNGPSDGDMSSDGGHYNMNENFRTSEPKYTNTIKRGKRNQDTEVACPVQSTYVPPRAALNDQSQWKYVVNVPERDQRFSQVVRVEVCLTEGEACSSRLSLPFGFESRCRQKYIKKKLLSLNPDGQGTSEDNFFIPSCCVCEIVRSTKK